MRKKSNETTLAEAMQMMLSEFRLGTELHERRIQSIWHAQMGKTISTYTSGIGLTIVNQVVFNALRMWER